MYKFTVTLCMVAVLTATAAFRPDKGSFRGGRHFSIDFSMTTMAGFGDMITPLFEQIGGQAQGERNPAILVR